VRKWGNVLVFLLIDKQKLQLILFWNETHWIHNILLIAHCWPKYSLFLKRLYSYIMDVWPQWLKDVATRQGVGNKKKVQIPQQVKYQTLRWRLCRQEASMMSHNRWLCGNSSSFAYCR
jgi:hypothetical protein